MGHNVLWLRDLADQCVLWLLSPLGVCILASGIDDLFIDAVWVWLAIRRALFKRPRVQLPGTDDLASAPRKRIAIFVPLWQEHQVIGDMLAHNIAAIRYNSYDFFVGVYPNDGPTLDAVRAAEARFPNVHIAVCPHDGPTFKADNLNWIYQRMLLHEEEQGIRHDAVLIQDAEDIIHPDSLHWVNWFIGSYGFVQIPVLALPTPIRRLVHGIYCDDFAEFHTRDLAVRNFLGGFVPSAGVGTAYSRDALEALAAASANRIFEPASLVEDYEIGLRLHRLGFRQLFLPLTRRGTLIATREFFPGTLGSAIRQRTRWTIGISLQAWERNGWGGDWRQYYWLWRDRKSLVSSPVSLLTNVICGYGILTAMWTRISPAGKLGQVLAATLAIQMVRSAVRLGCSARVYGVFFSLLSPVRAVAANYVNSTAVCKALWRYAFARLRGEPLVWVKTEHAYPSRAALLGERRRIGEILTGSGYIEPEVLEHALATQPPGVRLGEHLVSMGELSEEDLYGALSLQQNLPLAEITPDAVPRRVARSLPAALTAKWKVLPFRVQNGRLDIAGTELPDSDFESALRGHTSLEIRFHLIPPKKFHRLEHLLR